MENSQAGRSDDSDHGQRGYAVVPQATGLAVDCQAQGHPACWHRWQGECVHVRQASPTYEVKREASLATVGCIRSLLGRFASFSEVPDLYLVRADVNTYRYESDGRVDILVIPANACRAEARP